jgi:predicted ATPase
LLTLIGPGGVGKTRLAIAVAALETANYADGVFFVPLAPVTAPEFMAQAISDAIGLSVRGSPHAELIAHLRGKTMLLALDNLEHLASDLSLVAGLLEAAPGVKLLVTSRERLHLPGEWLFDIHGLRVPVVGQPLALERYSSAALFVQCARRVKPDFQPDRQEIAAVARICQALDGMPLGLELAAAWVRMLSCTEIAAEIERSFDFLAVSARHVPERQRSLRAAFDYSWRLLTSGERLVLRRLAVFRGGFERDAAQQVTGASVADLASLMDKSLLQRNGAAYTLHELIRQYAGEQLVVSGEEEEMRRGHAIYFVEYAEATEHYGPKQEWRLRLAGVHDNIRAALDWCLNHESSASSRLLALRLTAALAYFWFVNENWREGIRWLEQALAANDGLAQSLEVLHRRSRAKALVGLGVLLHFTGQFGRAQRCFDESLQLFRGLEDGWFTAWVLCNAAHTAQQIGDYTRCVTLAMESLEQFRRLDAAWGTALALERLSSAALDQGEYTAALTYGQEALALSRSLGSQAGIAASLNLLGRIAYGQGDLERAEGYYLEALDRNRARNSREACAWVLSNLGRLALAQADTARSLGYWREATMLRHELGNVQALLGCLQQMSETMAHAGGVEEPALLLAATTHLAEVLQIPAPDGFYASAARVRAAVCARLGADAFAEVEARGRAMTLDDAVAYALAVTQPA